MSAPISPDNQAVVGAAALAYGGVAIGVAYALAKYNSKEQAEKTDAATDRTPSLSSTAP